MGGLICMRTERDRHAMGDGKIRQTRTEQARRRTSVVDRRTGIGRVGPIRQTRAWAYFK